MMSNTNQELQYSQHTQKYNDLTIETGTINEIDIDDVPIKIEATDIKIEEPDTSTMYLHDNGTMRTCETSALENLINKTDPIRVKIENIDNKLDEADTNIIYLNKHDKFLDVMDTSEVIDTMGRNQAPSHCNKQQVNYVNISDKKNDDERPLSPFCKRYENNVTNEMYNHKSHNHNIGETDECSKLNDSECVKVEETCVDTDTNVPTWEFLKIEESAIKNERPDMITTHLNEDEIREVILDDDSDEELETEIEPGVSDSKKEPVPEDVTVRFQSRRPGDSGDRLDFTPPFIAINKTAAPDIDANSSPLSIFSLFFEEVFRLVSLETNRYFHQYCASQDIPVKSSDVTFEEIYKFLALTIQMGHDQRDTLKDYWRQDEQYHTPFYHNTMPRNRFFHILRFLHFADNNDAPNKEDPNYDRLWKIRKVFDTLNNKFSELYYPTENISVNEVIVLFKGRVIFRQYIPKKHKRFGIKIYKLNDSLGYTYNMAVYLGKQKELATENITATHRTVLQLIRRVEGVGHKLFMDNNFSSPLLFDDLLERKINSCGIVRHNRRDNPKDIGPKNMKLKKGDIITRMRGNLSVVRWKNKRDVYLLTNMHTPSSEGNFIGEFHDAIRPQVIEEYNKNMGYLDMAQRMANSYSIGRKSWKWTKKLFFHLVDISILNAYLLHKSVDGSMSHKLFREILVQNLIVEGQGAQIASMRPTVGRASPASTLLVRLEVRYSQHWPSKTTSKRCRVCSTKNKCTRTVYCCKKCNVGLCVVDCFEKWHTHVKF